MSSVASLFAAQEVYSVQFKMNSTSVGNLKRWLLETLVCRIAGRANFYSDLRRLDVLSGIGLDHQGEGI